jgi:hypothetical protein
MAAAPRQAVRPVSVRWSREKINSASFLEVEEAHLAIHVASDGSHKIRLTQIVV